jgi:hypothetical protein
MLRVELPPELSALIMAIVAIDTVACTHESK